MSDATNARPYFVRQIDHDMGCAHTDDGTLCRGCRRDTPSEAAAWERVLELASMHAKIDSGRATNEEAAAYYRAIGLTS